MTEISPEIPVWAGLLLIVIVGAAGVGVLLLAAKILEWLD